MGGGGGGVCILISWQTEYDQYNCYGNLMRFSWLNYKKKKKQEEKISHVSTYKKFQARNGRGSFERLNASN